MEKCSLRQLREKEIINLCDGKRLGYVNDIIFDLCCGKICAVSVLFDLRIFGFGKCEELIIPWDKITCFGKDTILVNLDVSYYDKLCGEKKCDKK